MEHSHWEVVANRERIEMFCRNLIEYYLPEQWKLDNINTREWDDSYWDAFNYQLEIAAQIALASLAEGGAEHLGLYAQYQRQSVANVMERYLTLSSSDTSQPLLAKMMMESRGIVEGDMLNPEFRLIGGWNEPGPQKPKARVFKKARERRRKD